MYTHKKLMTGCCVAVLTFGLAACSSGGGDDDGDDTPQASAPPTGGTPGGVVGPTTEPELDELATAQAAAADAAVAAETASGEAAESLVKAVAAGENHATLQTKSPTTGALGTTDVVADAMEYAASGEGSV